MNLISNKIEKLSAKNIKKALKMYTIVSYIFNQMYNNFGCVDVCAHISMQNVLL